MKREHLVSEAPGGIRFTDEETYVACLCGAEVTTATPQEAHDWFNRHRLDGGQHRGAGVRQTADSPQWKKSGRVVIPAKAAHVPSDKTGAELQRAYRERHPERLREQQRAYRERHPERIREMQRAYRARKRQERAA